MPFEMTWLIDNRVVIQRYYDSVTAEDFAQASAGLGRYLKAGQPPVHLVVDMLGVTRFPTNLTQLSSKVTKNDEALLGWTVVVTANALIRFLAGTYSQITRHRQRTVATFEDAIKFLDRLES